MSGQNVHHRAKISSLFPDNVADGHTKQISNRVDIDRKHRPSSSYEIGSSKKASGVSGLLYVKGFCVVPLSQPRSKDLLWDILF